MTLQEWMKLKPNDLVDAGSLPWKTSKSLPTVASVHVDKPLCDDDEDKKKKQLEKDLFMELINKQVAAGEIVKVDEDEHVVYAWASISSVEGQPYHDQQGDTITEHELEKAAHEFVLEVRKAGEMHTRTEGIGQLVASIVFTEQLQKALGINLGKTGWFTGWKIKDEDVWKKIKSGEYGALSIHGRGNREELT